MLQAVAQSSSFLFCTSWSYQGLFTLKTGDFLFSILTSKRCGNFSIFHIAPSSSLEEPESSYPLQMLISKTFPHDHHQRKLIALLFSVFATQFLQPKSALGAMSVICWLCISSQILSWFKSGVTQLKSEELHNLHRLWIWLIISRWIVSGCPY